MLDLEAIELIKQLKARYFRFLDSRNLEGLQTVFTEDAEIHFKSPSYQLDFKGWPELEGFYGGAFNEGSFGMHHGHMPEITVDGDTATGLWYLHDIFFNTESKTQFEGSSIYKDTYVKTAAGWKISLSEYERYLEVIKPYGDDVQITSSPIGNRFGC